MRNKRSPFHLPPRWRWLKWPFLGLSGSGTAVGVWQHEDPFALAGEIGLLLAALSGLHALVYGFYHRVFKTNSPCRYDTHYHLTKRD